jgi:hypothetical protein
MPTKNRCDQLLVDENLEEVFQFSLDPHVAAKYFFDGIVAEDMFDSHHDKYITKPRIDARRDDCKWLFQFAQQVIMQHCDIVEKFAQRVDLRNIDDWIEKNIVNIICMQHSSQKDGVAWHLDEEDTFAISVYDNGGIEFRDDDNRSIQHTTKDEIVASIGNTHIIEHRSIVSDIPRKVIVMFIKK